jgi:hypothetical protein
MNGKEKRKNGAKREERGWMQVHEATDVPVGIGMRGMDGEKCGINMKGGDEKMEDC